MPDADMTGEIPHSQPSEDDQQITNPFEEQPIQQVDEATVKNPENDQGFFGRIRHFADRRKDKPNPEELIRTDILRLGKLRTINQTVASTRFNPFGQPTLDIPDINAESAIDVYNIASSDEQKKQRKAYAQTALKSIIETKLILTGDLRTLYIDQGKTPDEIREEVEGLTTFEVRGKKRQFEHLDKDAQISILENISEKRSAMLRANWPDYIYYVTTDMDALGLTDSDIEKLKDEYAAADEQTQVRLAAEARQNALKAMDRTRKVNLDRLGELLKISGVTEDETKERLEEFRGRFRTGTLADKDRIIDEIIEAKQMLVLPHLDEIIHLREVIEHHKQKTPTEVDPTLDDSQRLYVEAQEIKDSLTNAPYSYAINEATTLHLAEDVGKIAAEVGDPSLIDAFKLVELLETKV